MGVTGTVVLSKSTSVDPENNTNVVSSRRGRQVRTEEGKVLTPKVPVGDYMKEYG